LRASVVCVSTQRAHRLICEVRNLSSLTRAVSSPRLPSTTSSACMVRAEKAGARRSASWERSLAVGVLVHDLAAHPDLQARLRQQPDDLPAAIDEILRLHPALIASRRVTACPVEIGGRKLEAGERTTLIWASANGDEAVFGHPDCFDPEGNREHNLVYCAGAHACPGRRWPGSSCAC
jgi:hypothetical protein